MAYLKTLFQVAFVAVGLTSAIQSKAQQPSIFLADPTIFADKGRYYLYGTSSNKGFLVYESADLKTWKQPEDTARQFALKRGETFGDKGFWAPQVFTHKGSYYMAYTANEQIAIAKASSPAGPFRQDSFIKLSGTGKQIDPFVFFDKGKIYLYHVKLQNGNRIFVTEMKPDLSDVIPGTEKECISSSEGWENTAKAEWPVAEGPTVLKHKNTYYLIYSSNDFRNKDYAVGYATSRSPTGPWRKYAGNPIISRHTVGHNGTGHGDVFADKKGQLYYVLHTHNTDDRVSPRATAVVKLKFKTVKGGEDVLEADGGSFEFLRSDVPAEKTFAIKNVNVIPMTLSGDVITNASLIIRKDRIVSLKDAQRFAQMAKDNGTWLSPTLTTMKWILSQARSLDELRQSPTLQYVHPLLQSKWLTANSYNRNTSADRVAYFQKMVDFHTRLVKAFHAAGVPMVVGTDMNLSGVVAGFSTHDEMELLAEAGLTPKEVLAAATRIPATWLGIDSLIGTIEAGKRADLLLLEDNPLEDVRNARKIAGVFVNGRWVDQATIRDMMADLSRRNTAAKDQYDWKKTISQ